MDRKSLFELVEKLRHDLIKMYAVSEDFSDPEILRKSAELDRALNLLFKHSNMNRCNKS